MARITQHPWQIGKTPDQVTLTDWERVAKIAIPSDYRGFMLKYGGGVVRPWLFRHDHPHVDPEVRDPAILDYLHTWDRVMEETAAWPKSRPPLHLLIGQDPGGGAIMLSLESGAVVYWVRTATPWGEPENDAIGTIAPSFTAFINTLFEQPGFDHPDWDILAARHSPQELKL